MAITHTMIDPFFAVGVESYKKYVVGSMDTTADVAISAAHDKLEYAVESKNYLLMLLVIFLIDQKRHAEVATL